MIQTRSISPSASFHPNCVPIPVRIPDADHDRLVTAIAENDASWVAGANLSIKNNGFRNGWPCSVNITTSGGAGTCDSWVEISGLNQFSEKVTEKLHINTGAGTVISKWCYQRVDRITVLSVPGAPSTRNIEFGWTLVQNSLLALPWRPSSDVVGSGAAPGAGQLVGFLSASADSWLNIDQIDMAKATARAGAAIGAAGLYFLHSRLPSGGRMTS